MRLQHAKHNEDACNAIYQLEKYNDWVVTTAFYSALHYVNHKLFPSEYEGTQFATLDTYYRHRFISSNRKPSKHWFTLNLVKEKLPTINASYRRLFELSSNARYIDYQTTPRLMEEARKSLIKVKGVCGDS